MHSKQIALNQRFSKISMNLSHVVLIIFTVFSDDKKTTNMMWVAVTS